MHVCFSVYSSSLIMRCHAITAPCLATLIMQRGFLSRTVFGSLSIATCDLLLQPTTLHASVFTRSTSSPRLSMLQVKSFSLLRLHSSTILRKEEIKAMEFSMATLHLNVYSLFQIVAARSRCYHDDERATCLVSFVSKTWYKVVIVNSLIPYIDE